MYSFVNVPLKTALFGDFPGGPVVKNPPSNARDTGSIPGWGTKIPQEAGQLSPRPQLLSPHAATTEPTRSGAYMPQLERSPQAATKTRRSQKYILN